ncbi:MAG: hypothetical protein V1887_00920 [Candidatus Aenigmatarchaeota archaeon]
MSKGLELPVNVLVIIAIAVIILIAMIALLTTGIISWRPGEVALAKGDACSKLINAGCDAADTLTIDTSLRDSAGAYEKLQTLCEKEYGVAAGDAVACMKVCGCPGL